MADHFLPRRNPTLAQDRYRKFSQAARIAIGSEYVVHIAEDGSQQVLYMKFQDMPETIDLGIEVAGVTSGPRIWGRVEEFERVPKQYRSGSASQKSRMAGSRFVIHGKVYDAKKVENHHLGGVMIDLVHARSCDVTDITFIDKVRPYVCLQERD